MMLYFQSIIWRISIHTHGKYRIDTENHWRGDFGALGIHWSSIIPVLTYLSGDIYWFAAWRKETLKRLGEAKSATGGGKSIALLLTHSFETAWWKTEENQAVIKFHLVFILMRASDMILYSHLGFISPSRENGYMDIMIHFHTIAQHVKLRSWIHCTSPSQNACNNLHPINDKYRMRKSVCMALWWMLNAATLQCVIDWILLSFWLHLFLIPLKSFSAVWPCSKMTKPLWEIPILPEHKGHTECNISSSP